MKELHSDAVEEDQARFLREAAINGQFNGHPNIVHLYGVVTIGTPVSKMVANSSLHFIMGSSTFLIFFFFFFFCKTMIVLELLSNGNLRDYLQDSNKRLVMK